MRAKILLNSLHFTLWRQGLLSSRGNELVWFKVFRYKVAPNCCAFCLQLFQVIMTHVHTHTHTHLISWSLYSIITRKEICHNTAHLSLIFAFLILTTLICQNSNIPHRLGFFPKAQATVAAPLTFLRVPATPFDMYVYCQNSNTVTGFSPSTVVSLTIINPPMPRTHALTYHRRSVTPAVDKAV